MEILRNPISNQIEEFSFDINEPSLTSIFLDQITRNLLRSTNSSQLYNSRDDNSRIIIDPSNNFLFYETVISPSRSHSRSRSRSRPRTQTMTQPGIHRTQTGNQNINDQNNNNGNN